MKKNESKEVITYSIKIICENRATVAVIYQCKHTVNWDPPPSHPPPPMLFYSYVFDSSPQHIVWTTCTTGCTLIIGVSVFALPISIVWCLLTLASIWTCELRFVLGCVCFFLLFFFFFFFPPWFGRVAGHSSESPDGPRALDHHVGSPLDW